MGELIAGEGGSVLVAAATSQAAALACEGIASLTRTPSGVPVYPIGPAPPDGIDRVRLLPCEPRTRVTVMSWGLPFVDEDLAQLTCSRPVVAISSLSTGAGKTALTRRVARTLARSGVRTAVARHPIASLLHWDRFDPVVVRTPPELASPRPIGEREEIAPLVGAGIPVVSGLDAERVLRLAESLADVVVWDGGGAARPWVQPTLHLVAIDALRPWTADVGDGDVFVITKADSAPPELVSDVEQRIAGRTVVLADLAVGVQPGSALTDRRVVIVEDAASLMLGGLPAGAGAVAARRFRCGVVDPRPFAVGAIADALRADPSIAGVIPSLGRTPAEIEDLAASVAATPGDAVLWASNADPAGVLLDETRPIVRAFGELTEVAGPSVQELLAPFLPGHAP